jgi:hypothetical protein
LTDLALFAGVMLIFGPWLLKIAINYLVHFGYLVCNGSLSIAGHAQAAGNRWEHRGPKLALIAGFS